MIHQRKILKAIAYAILLCFTSLTGAQPLYAIPANTQLPTGPNGIVGKPHDVLENVTTVQNGNTLTITQDGKTSVLKWGDFSIGADAAVNFVGEKGFNSLNYVTGANAPISEIYGQLTALGGNIFIANPAGVQIGNSAQINVGSLYVTNKNLEDAVNGLNQDSTTEQITQAINGKPVAATNAELMSLGAIVNAKNVTFDGGRIVLDTDRIYADNTEGELQPVDDAKLTGMLNIITTDKDNVVLGSSERADIFTSFSINGDKDKLEKGYTWVHDIDELQAMNKNTSGWYALRNSIDANAMINFNPIGNGQNTFTGRFDGLGYSIFGLNIDNRTINNVGLFGYAQNATIRNFTLNSSEIKGGANTGAVVGHAYGGKIENVTNTGNVTGGDGTGGIVGKAENKVAMSGLINIGKVTGRVDTGGVVGSMSGGTLGGDTYNLGSVTGTSSVGGIAGSVTNATIGNEVTQDNPDAFQIFNQLNVTGDHNVGGIAGAMSGGKIANAANHGNVKAEGYKEDTYQYHTAAAESNLDGATLSGNNLASIEVKAANAGGIAGAADGGASVTGVINDGDVTSTREGGDNHYKAGNVGGIVGRAKDTTITNAENKENTVAGAHNVGGVAGFLGGNSTIDVGVNNGGDITATGARKFDDSGFAKERVRPAEGNEIFNIGNIGGIVGYLFGDSAKVKNSGNRGTVQSAKIDDANNVPETAKAANVGGVVGKIDMQNAANIDWVKKQEDNTYVNANVANSYNTGDVQGYTGVGGVAGMMYNGSIAGSYNLGTVNTTRQVDNSGGDIIDPLNMGGVVGDATEQTDASAVLYDVYNAGQIGDETYKYFARHVGGIAGRLSGYIEKAYNTGNIYNYDTTVGGIVGWWYNGGISNVFNTGNITVRTNTEMQVGGIVGASSANAQSLSYAYNLGTIRGFQENSNEEIFVGGIIGRARGGLSTTIDNAYTLGNIYAARGIYGGTYTSVGADNGLGAIYGGLDAPKLSNANYITPDNPTDDSKPKFVDLSEKATIQDIKVVEYADRSNADKYQLEGLNKLNTATNWSVNDGAWRLYEGGTPILNAFTPNMADTGAWKEQLEGTGATVQYGTAYNPMLTIVNLEKANGIKDVKFNWSDLGLYGAGGLAVYGGGLTINDFESAGDGRYFGGTIFSDHALAMDGTGTNFNLGSASKLYGSSVTLTNGGDISAYGEITSTNGGIEITGKNVEIIGSLTAKAQGKTTEIDGISGASTTSEMDTTNLNDPNKAMKSVSEMFTYTTGEAEDHGDITVNASGAAEVLYGNLGTGSVSTAGNFTVNGGTTDGGKTFSGGSVYVDSDLSGTTGDINLSAGGEVLLDITNIAKANKSDEDKNGAVALHTFLDNHSNGKTKITLNSTNDDEIIAIDMWDNGRFDLDKYNDGDKTFGGAIQALGEDLAGKTHIWISDAEQLKGIQSYYDYDNVTTTGETTKILNYNFALKGNIDASALTGYEEIGGGDEAYSGTFDGRDFRIIGLNTNASSEQDASSGIFGTLAGTVKDLRVYASKFFGGDGESAGAIASEVTEGGKITGVTTFGNTVTAEKGAAGGIAGKNSGSILESTASDSVTASGANAYAGGVAGVNTGSIGEKGGDGESAQITADSAVRSGTDGAAAIGGVVGKNENGGKVWLANSLGVTTGANAGSTGGIAGTNSSEMTSLYNESIVTGGSNVGGVAGDNSGTMENAVNATGITATDKNAGGLAGVNSGKIDSGRNAGVVTGGQNVGGLVGANKKENDEKPGILKNLSNALAAVINGKKFVGGIAGSNSGTITGESNLINEGAITGVQFVGGIAGQNSGEIRGGNAEDQRLTNKASINGTQYVGGIAGQNTGTIENTNAESKINAVDGKLDHESENLEKQFFGGVTGENIGIIDNATNTANLRIEGGKFVGGITGRNSKIIGDDGEITTEGVFKGKLVNKGAVYGDANVGGIAGMNQADNVLVGTKEEKLIVSNENTVEAENGGAAGIFHTNSGRIEYAEISNSGKIIGNESDGSGGENTGALFGVNTGSITNSTLKNSGEVTGGKNTGGLIGTNTGNITYSSLINEVGAKVTGTENVGGLIGYNTGAIKGGRIDDSGKDLGLYTYKIYNNGTVSGSANVGGLIGNNAVEGDKTGSLTAGYNTGVVSVTENSEGKNVGGIVGVNAGTIDQVFNTIMTGVDNLGATLFGAVTGENNVGGIIGSNTGKLTNAYNTTGVTGTTNIGNIVGKNTDTVENVYATNETGTLVGDGNAKGSYSFSEADNEKEGITVIEPAAKNKQGSYEQFDFTGDSGTPAVWKIYEGKNGQEASGTPLLKVFLTNAEYSGETSFTYNGNNQGLSLDGVTVDGEKLSDVAKTLLSALEGKNAYNGYLGFTSEQIAGSTTKDGDGSVVFNPNNLGYDIDATFSIGKLLLSVKDIIASIVYGGSKYEVTGGVLEGVIEGDSIDIDVDFADMSKEELDKLIVEGSEYDKSKGGRATADVLYGDDGKVAAYENSLLYNGSLSLTGNDADNYALAEDTTVGGSITVEKAKLNVELGTVERTYGNTGITTEGGYKVTDSFKQHLVNGDKNLGYAVSNFNVTVAENGDTALTGVSTGRVTKDANLENESYYWTAEKVSGVNGETLTNLSKNYDIIVNGQGKSIVNKAPLSITLNDVTRIYGEAETFVGGIGYGIDSVDGLVNGDEDYENALKLIDGAFENELIADSGLLPNGWTNDANDNNDEKPNYTWTVKDNNINAFEGIDKLSQNYTLTVNKGESFVEKLALTISDVFATIVYGDQNGTGFKIAEGGKLTGIVYDDDVSLSKELKIEDAEFAAGGSYESSRNGRTTADAGIYDNETLTFSDLTLSGTKAGNYTLNKDVEGDIVVKKAVLTLTPDNATTTYGTAFDENSYSYTLSGVTNDDEENALRTAIGVLEYGNDAAFYGEGGKYTADVATHNNAVYIKNLNEKMLTNYNVVGDKGAAIITKATLDVALNPVERTYGDTTLTHGDYSINTDWLDKLVNGDELMYTGDEISISGIISDKAVIDEYTTNDAGGHSWSAKVNTSALAQNYNINKIAIGSSIVNKAKLTVNAGHAETTYGTPFDKNKYYYDLVGVTNGDSESEIKAQIGNVAYDNTAAIEDGGDRVTDNAGVNGVLSILTDLFGIELGNYEIEKVNDGTATVEKADLFITAHDKHTHVGREPEYTGTTLDELELVNGDTLANFSHTFGIEEASMLDEAGHYAGTIAAVVDGQYYYDGTHDWSAHHDVFANYKVNVEAGNLTVVRPMPTVPHYNYGWLYNDAPYGRKWNFRERKAEIYFQDGGMAYDKNM